MNKIELSKTFVRVFKKLPKEVRSIIRSKWIPKLQDNAYTGEKLKGKDLSNYYKVKFVHKKCHYRLIYTYDKKEVTILLITIGARENFYKKFKKTL